MRRVRMTGTTFPTFIVDEFFANFKCNSLNLAKDNTYESNRTCMLWVNEKYVCSCRCNVINNVFTLY